MASSFGYFQDTEPKKLQGSSRQIQLRRRSFAKPMKRMWERFQFSFFLKWPIFLG